MQKQTRTYNLDSIAAIQRRLGLSVYPLWLRYLLAALALAALTGALLWLADGGGLTWLDAMKYVAIVSLLAFIGRALWRISRRESNLYYGNILSQISLLVASRRERVRSTIIAAGALVLGMAFLCFATAALLYALSADGLYTPFKTTPSFAETLLFIFDQAAKGLFFDAMEVFDIDISTLEVASREKWVFGAFLVLFRLFFSIVVIGAFIAYVLQRAMKLAGYKITLS
ncbi:MAG: hypothetical protein NW215_06605 [Hyphomicrobiales bacterium]|nr:hypothetical protein [Hyphomicrobiales bacterium]